jgi:hypothetical protein
MADQTSATQDGTQTGDGTGQGTDKGTQQNAGISFTTEQQAHMDSLIADRLTRAKGKWETDRQAAADKAGSDAEAKRLADDSKFAELADKRLKETETVNAKLIEAQNVLRTYRLKDAFRLQADTVKAKFATTQAEQDAFALLDLAAVQLGEDGKVTGMDKALTGLQTSRPYLFAKAEAAGSINAGEGVGAGAPPDDKAYRAEITQRYRLGK